MDDVNAPARLRFNSENKLVFTLNRVLEAVIRRVRGQGEISDDQTEGDRSDLGTLLDFLLRNGK